jgi:hypothetical protein
MLCFVVAPAGPGFPLLGRGSRLRAPGLGPAQGADRECHAHGGGQPQGESKEEKWDEGEGRTEDMRHCRRQHGGKDHAQDSHAIQAPSVFYQASLRTRREPGRPVNYETRAGLSKLKKM